MEPADSRLRAIFHLHSNAFEIESSDILTLEVANWNVNWCMKEQIQISTGCSHQSHAGLVHTALKSDLLEALLSTLSFTGDQIGFVAFAITYLTWLLW